MSYPPLYGAPVIGAYGSVFDERAEQLRAQDAAARRMAFAGAELLKQMFPSVDASCVDYFRDSFVGFVCCGTDEQLKQLEEQKAQAIQFSGPSDEERLIQLVQERDRENERIAEMEAACRKFPDGMGDAMLLALKNSVGNALEWKEKEISALQNKIERAHAERSVTETSPESANS